MRTIESQIQKACVKWFHYQYAKYEHVFFSVPNGGKRSKKTGKTMKDEGVLAGVADLILLVPNGDYHGLCIEMKKPKGKQQETQKVFQEAVEKQGYKYVLCYSIDDFIREIKEYLND